MATVTNYVRAKSLEEAYELNRKKSARIAGGMMWLRLGNKRIATVIDLSGLGLDQITEDESNFEFGCMASLRDMETHAGFNAYTGGAAKESVRHIVGVQFRNTATIGGSLFGRYGFSDVLTLFMALDAEVEMYKAGRMSILDFVDKKREQVKDHDILVKVIVHKTPMRVAYLSQRNSKTDFPVLTCAVSIPLSDHEDASKPALAVIGARPHKAAACFDEQGILAGVLEDQVSREEACEKAASFARAVREASVFGSNTRASGEYRELICQVLIKRAVLALKDSQASEKE